MTIDPSSPSPDRAPARPRTLTSPRARALALGGAVVVLSLLAAACGGGGGGSTAQVEAGGSGNATAEPITAGEFMSTRPGAGIAAARGNPQVVQGENPCDSSAASEPIRIAYMGADLASLDDAGLESLIIEEPGRVIEAYVNEVNFHGGIGGRCVEFHSYLWDLGNATESITEVCVELPQQNVLFSFVLRADASLLSCVTTAAQVPTVGLYASAPSATFEAAGGRFYADDGSTEYLLTSSVDIALQTGLLDMSEPVGLLHGAADQATDPSLIEQTLRSRGLDLVSSAVSPASNLAVLVAEKQVRLLESGLSESEQREVEMKLTALPPEIAEVLKLVEAFYLDAAEGFKDSGVTAVVTTADWSDVRRFMRAAELVGWTPMWIINDIQPATLTLTEAPERQAGNLVSVSARRAAGDAIPELDRSCMSLRNTASDAPTFSHRHHTDAWSLLQATCDYLDVTFSAMTRAAQADGTLTRESFMAAMHQTSYDTEYGTLITFGEDNPYGWDRFRVLEADPACVLNHWGCMRSTTDWLAPAG